MNTEKIQALSSPYPDFTNNPDNVLYFKKEKKGEGGDTCLRGMPCIWLSCVIISFDNPEVGIRSRRSGGGIEKKAEIRV